MFKRKTKGERMLEKLGCKRECNMQSEEIWESGSLGIRFFNNDSEKYIDIKQNLPSHYIHIERSLFKAINQRAKEIWRK